jgi:hypothetical protein
MTTGNERQIRTERRWPGWETKVITSALVYWELDRGGPVARRHAPRHELRKTDLPASGTCPDLRVNLDKVGVREDSDSCVPSSARSV